MTADVKLLDVQNLSIGVRGAEPRTLLAGIAFDLSAHQVIGVIGESGSGKTVLSRALVNWIRPPLEVCEGTIKFQGRDLLSIPESEMSRLRGREIAYIGADPGSALDPTMTVGRQLVEKLLAVEPGAGKADARKRVLSLLDAVRIPSYRQRIDDFPFQFSGGMMQRVMIVDALITNPALLVADNITQPLDVTVAAQILRLLKELQRDFKTGIVFVSSSLGIINDIADRVVVIANGRLVEDRPVTELIKSPDHLYTRRLIEQTPKIWGERVKAPEPGGEAETPVVISARNLTKTYEVPSSGSIFRKRQIKAVRGVSFDALRGENLGIIGESGCGKSTLSRLLSRLEAPDSGQILFKGQDMARMRGREELALRKRFQLILQDPFNAIPSHLTIGRTIAEPLLVQGKLSRKLINEKVRATMGEVGLSTAFFDRLPVGLSAGQRQRVNIARAMVLDPELLILDETLSALDQVEQRRLLDLFLTLQVRHGITYIFISHDLSMVRQVCNRIAVMYLGRMVEVASNDAIFFDPGHPYTRALLSAVPTIEHRPFARTTYLMEGEPPDPVDIPPGCTFKTRCPFAFAPCETIDPPLLPRGSQDAAACHLADPSWAGRSKPMPSLDWARDAVGVTAVSRP